MLKNVSVHYRFALSDQVCAFNSLSQRPFQSWVCAKSCCAAHTDCLIWCFSDENTVVNALSHNGTTWSTSAQIIYKTFRLTHGLTLCMTWFFVNDTKWKMTCRHVSILARSEAETYHSFSKLCYLSSPCPFFAFSLFFAVSLLVVKSIKLSVRLAELHHLAAVKAKQTR